MNILKNFVLALLIINVILNGILFYSEYSGNDFCITGNDSCNAVQTTRYGELFGIKLTYMGLPIFTALLIIFILAQYDKTFNYIFVASTLFGAFFASYFLGIQYLMIEQTCSNCLLIDNIAIIVFILSFTDFLASRRSQK